MVKRFKTRIFGKEISTAVTFIGLANAGKTTLVQYLKGEIGEITTTYVPTMGMSVETLQLGGHEVMAADMGGQKSFLDSFWKPFVTKSQAIVFVFDSSDESNMEEAKEYLKLVISWVTPDSVFLFLANKCDVKDALSMEEIIKRLDLSRIISQRPHSFGVYTVSALLGTNVEEAWNWLAEKFESHENDS